MPFGYLLKRIFLLILIVWSAATLNFFIPHLTPRNPIQEKLMEQATRGGYMQEGMQEMLKAYEAKFGLDRPVWEQYLTYLGNMARLDLGYSIANYPRTVLGLVAEALPWTIGLLTTATIVAFLIGNLLGALVAWSATPGFLRNLARRLVLPLMALSAIPYYLLGLVLIYFLAFQLRIFPLGGGYSIGRIPSVEWSFIMEMLYHSILPALSIVLAAIGFWALGMRGMMVTVQGEDYMTFAEAKGLKEGRIFYKYAIRNALLPQVTALALSLGYVVSGAVLVELVFGYPGIGTLLARSVYNLDYFMIYGIVFVIIVAIGIAMLIVDLIYPLLDPRITTRG